MLGCSSFSDACLFASISCRVKGSDSRVWKYLWQFQRRELSGKKRVHKLKQNPQDTGRVSLGHLAGQTGVYRPVSQGFPVNCHRSGQTRAFLPGHPAIQGVFRYFMWFFLVCLCSLNQSVCAPLCCKNLCCVSQFCTARGASDTRDAQVESTQAVFCQKSAWYVKIIETRYYESNFVCLTKVLS